MKSIKILFTALCGLALFGCNNENNKFDASGTFEATEVVVSSEAMGRIEKFELREGDILKKNQIVGYVDTLQLYYQKLQLEANQKTMMGRKQDVNLQIASLESQINNLKSEKIRYEKLVQSNAGNQKMVDDTEAQILYLEKQLQAQKSTLKLNNESLDNESLSVDVQITRLNDQIRRCKIFSPIDGTVLIKYAEEGEITQPSKALFKIADTENMIFKAYVTADQFTQLKIGQQVKVFADFGNDYREYDGSVTWISDKSEFTPKTIQTKNERANLVYAVKIAVKNDNYLKIGMYGQLKIQ